MIAKNVPPSNFDSVAVVAAVAAAAAKAVVVARVAAAGVAVAAAEAAGGRRRRRPTQGGRHARRKADGTPDMCALQSTEPRVAVLGVAAAEERAIAAEARLLAEVTENGVSKKSSPLKRLT